LLGGSGHGALVVGGAHAGKTVGVTCPVQLHAVGRVGQVAAEELVASCADEYP